MRAVNNPFYSVALCDAKGRCPHRQNLGEHVVVRTDEPAAGLCSVYAESSLCELLDDFIEEAQLVSRTAAQALAAVLAPTR